MYEPIEYPLIAFNLVKDCEARFYSGDAFRHGYNLFYPSEKHIERFRGDSKGAYVLDYVVTLGYEPEWYDCNM